MKICLIVDAQSPHSQRWIELLDAAGNEVHLISTWPTEDANLPVKSTFIAPVDFSTKIRSSEKAASMGTSRSAKSKLISKVRGTPLWKLVSSLRNRMAPLMVRRQSKLVAARLDEIKPDIVHAMRIPFEGLLASAAIQRSRYPFVVSTWGNDFTLFAQRDPIVRSLTMELISRVDALHTDCEKDMVIAKEWGLDPKVSTLVAPGNGGVDASIFSPSEHRSSVREALNLPGDVPIVINPRGLKEYIRNDTFFASIPLILNEYPDAIFLCISMEGKAVAENYCEQYQIGHAVRLMPSVSHTEMARLFQASDVVVSSSDHDGTPISLLESMACGCFPVAGDIPSSYEWVTDGQNGFIHDRTSPADLAEKVISALAQPALRASAASLNQVILQERASRVRSTERMMDLYRKAIQYFDSKGQRV